MEQIEKSNSSRNEDPAVDDPSSCRQSRVRTARPFRTTHLYDSLSEIRESAMATEEPPAEGPAVVEADQVEAEETLPSAQDDDVCRHKKMNNSNKTKLLVRSHALREAASPPPDSPSSIDDHQDQPQASLVITVVDDDDVDVSPQEIPAQLANRLRPRVQVESSQCSVDSSSSFVSFSLSRDSSTELAGGCSHLYTDNTGVDLHHFIVETLHRNYKDRMTLLRIEQDMIALVLDAKRTCHRFPAMSSYHRMLVHRVAAYFGMEHNVDQSGNCVVVSKSRHTRLPDVAFKEYVRDDIVLPEEPNRKLNTKRETVSFDEVSNKYNKYSNSPETRSRSLEEHDVLAVVDRPRNNPRALQHQSQVTWIASPDGGARSKENLSSSDYSAPTVSRNSSGGGGEEIRWPKRLGQGTGPFRTNRIPKVESFDSRDLLCGYGNSLRPTVAKSYSFGGYTVGPDEVAMRDERRVASGPRFLSKQDSNSSSISISRSSPTSSGYKSQQSGAPSPVPNGQRVIPLRAQHNGSCSLDSAQTATPCETNNATLLWAVTSLDAVPPGSILINPQTGQPFYNADGSAYRYDPQLPLPFQVDGSSNETGDEQGESYESYETQSEIVKVDEIQEPVASSVPVYPSWPQYENPAAAPVHYLTGQQPQSAYFNQSHDFASFHSTNGVSFLGPAGPFDEQHVKTGNYGNVALPVAHGHGYVLYQACLGPPGDGGQQSVDELYSAMKNLSLRPIAGPMTYPSNFVDTLSHQAEMSTSFRPVNGKTQATCNVLPTRSDSTPPAVAPSNAYLASVRVPQNNGQMMHHGAGYPMMYPSHPQVSNRQHHFFPSTLVQQLNNSQYAPTSWSLLTNRATPEREADVPTRMVAVSQPNQQQRLYGPSLPSPFLAGGAGDVCGAMRHSPTVLHRQFSLPNPSAPPAMYTLRPRIQQQHQMPVAPRPSFQPGALGFTSRHVRTRRHVYRPGFATDPRSSPSPSQQFPSTTS